jgi:hypothetical protein
MGFVDDEHVKTGGPGHDDAIDDLSREGAAVSASPDDLPPWAQGGVTAATGVFVPADSQAIIKFFEVNSGQWQEEDYAWAPHYRDVYSIENFSKRVKEQMMYYPGMHQSNEGHSPYSGYANQPDPFQQQAQKMGESQLNYWNQAMDNPDSFMAGMKARQGSFDYTKLFDSKDDFKKNAAAIITECIPCFDRLFDGAQLLPDGDILEVHLLNINLRTDLLDKLKELFADPGFNIDICELLKLLSHLCPQDLLAILALLSQYLAKLNLDFAFNLDLIIELIGPILSPFLDALSEWLDKWVQMILAPIICVIDHINMTIYLAQQIKLPLSESQVNLDYSAGLAGPNIVGNLGKKFTDGWVTSHAQSESGIHAGFNPEGENEYSPYAFGYSDNELFNTPDSQLYNPDTPELPREEWEAALAESGQAWGIDPSDNSPEWYATYAEMSEEERRKMWEELYQERQQKELEFDSLPRNQMPKADGTRWSANDVPGSEKKFSFQSFSHGQVPPNQQAPKPADEYYLDGGAIVDPILQMRNIIQGAIAYVQDWFDWVVQLVYDLLGTDFGWMKKKHGQTVLKSRVIQLIYMLKAIIEALLEEDAFECGVHTNINPEFMRRLLTKYMNRVSPYEFKERPDGTFELIRPGDTRPAPDIDDLAQDPTAEVEGEQKHKTPEQKAAESGIIIKDCLKSVSTDELEKMRAWIRDFEKRSVTNG